MIYADNASTTKISELALEKMLPYLSEFYGNASSSYSFGLKAKHAINESREKIAISLKCSPEEIIFTSSGSESNSWVISSVSDGHVITSSIEHQSVINACFNLQQRGVNVSFLPVDSKGRVSLDSIKKTIQKDTKLVSVMLANNEIGTIQPIKEIGAYLRERNIPFHTDAVQALGHIPVDVNELHVDFLTASAHKFNGAKGVGILFKSCKSPISKRIFGGAQEHGLRSGTENVAGIVSAGYALEENILSMNQNASLLNSFSQLTIMGLKANILNATFNGDQDNCLPGLISVSLVGVSGESMMHVLDLKGICVSTGSACKSGSDKPSHVLNAIGLSKSQVMSTIRISYGKHNTIIEVESIIDALCKTYKKLIQLV